MAFKPGIRVCNRQLKLAKFGGLSGVGGGVRVFFSSQMRTKNSVNNVNMIQGSDGGMARSSVLRLRNISHRIKKLTVGLGLLGEKAGEDFSGHG